MEWRASHSLRPSRVVACRHIYIHACGPCLIFVLVCVCMYNSILIQAELPYCVWNLCGRLPCQPGPRPGKRHRLPPPLPSFLFGIPLFLTAALFSSPLQVAYLINIYVDSDAENLCVYRDQVFSASGDDISMDVRNANPRK